MRRVNEYKIYIYELLYCTMHQLRSKLWICYKLCGQKIILGTPNNTISRLLPVVRLPIRWTYYVGNCPLLPGPTSYVHLTHAMINSTLFFVTSSIRYLILAYSHSRMLYASYSKFGFLCRVLNSTPIWHKRHYYVMHNCSHNFRYIHLKIRVVIIITINPSLFSPLSQYILRVYPLDPFK